MPGRGGAALRLPQQPAGLFAPAGKFIGTIQRVLCEGPSKSNKETLSGRTSQNKIVIFKMTLISPPILVTSILFGLAHGFSLDNDYQIVFNLEPFLRTAIYGIIWAWITIKSGNILLALLSHNFNNGFGTLISMR